MKPEISVVIPTRDQWSLLATTVQSALGQRGVDIEVIVVDDGSMDATGHGLASIDDPRLRVIRHSKARGVAVGRNRGIAEARGEWVAFLDHDDLWAPDKLSTQLELAGEASLTFSACVVVDEGLHEHHVLLPPDPVEDLASDLLRAQVIPGATSNVMARRDLLERLGGFDEEFSSLADWEMWIRLAAEAPARTSNDILVAYREHPSSWGALRPEETLIEAEQLMEKHGSHDALDKESLVRWVIGSHRRAGRRIDAARLYLHLTRLDRRPSNLLRAGAVLLGERSMRIGRPRLVQPPQVDWLDAYRPRQRSSAPE
jgi:glycosyltransferase involved in cell wall biosynthesis